MSSAFAGLMQAAGGAGRRMFRPHRVTWEAKHADRTTTTLIQQPDGSFVGAIEQCERIRVVSQARTLEQAKAAVAVVLADYAGHRVCTDDCSEWTLRVERHGQLEAGER